MCVIISRASFSCPLLLFLRSLLHPLLRFHTFLFPTVWVDLTKRSEAKRTRKADTRQSKRGRTHGCFSFLFFLICFVVLTTLPTLQKVVPLGYKIHIYQRPVQTDINLEEEEEFLVVSDISTFTSRGNVQAPKLNNGQDCTVRYVYSLHS